MPGLTPRKTDCLAYLGSAAAESSLISTNLAGQDHAIGLGAALCTQPDCLAAHLADFDRLPQAAWSVPNCASVSRRVPAIGAVGNVVTGQADRTRSWKSFRASS